MTIHTHLNAQSERFIFFHFHLFFLRTKMQCSKISVGETGRGKRREKGKTRVLPLSWRQHTITEPKEKKEKKKRKIGRKKEGRAIKKKRKFQVGVWLQLDSRRETRSCDWLMSLTFFSLFFSLHFSFPLVSLFDRYL